MAGQQGITTIGSSHSSPPPAAASSDGKGTAVSLHLPGASVLPPSAVAGQFMGWCTVHAGHRCCRGVLPRVRSSHAPPRCCSHDHTVWTSVRACESVTPPVPACMAPHALPCSMCACLAVCGLHAFFLAQARCSAAFGLACRLASYCCLLLHLVKACGPFSRAVGGATSGARGQPVVPGSAPTSLAGLVGALS